MRGQTFDNVDRFPKIGAPPPIQWNCPATGTPGHTFREGHAINRFELLLFCERCGKTRLIDSTQWERS